MLKPRPTDAEFDELKRKRNESVASAFAKMCEEMGWDPMGKISLKSHEPNKGDQ